MCPGARVTRIERHLAAPPAAVFRALVEPEQVKAWKFPAGMSIEVHEFQPWEGGRFRVSLTYHDASAAGKTSAHTDTYHGYFLRLVPGREVVEVTEFEGNDPSTAGEMRITYQLSARDCGTDLVATHENVPPGIRLEDNETGWTMALQKLAVLLESGKHGS